MIAALLALSLAASPERPYECPFAIALEIPRRLERCVGRPPEGTELCVGRVRRTARLWGCMVPPEWQSRLRRVVPTRPAK